MNTNKNTNINLSCARKNLQSAGHEEEHACFHHLFKYYVFTDADS